MVKATQAWQGNQTGMSHWFSLDRTSGRVFAQGVVNAILLMIAHVLADYRSVHMGDDGRREHLPSPAMLMRALRLDY